MAPALAERADAPRLPTSHPIELILNR